MFGRKCEIKLLVIAIVLSLSGCAMRGLDYNGGYSFPQPSGWYKLKYSEIAAMPQIPWFSSVVSNNEFESYDFYVKRNKKDSPDTYEAVLALTVSPPLSKYQKTVLTAEVEDAEQYLQKKGTIEAALKDARNGEPVSKRIHGTFWIVNSDQADGEIMHTIKHNRRYSLYFYEDTNLVESPVDVEGIQSINLKPFGFLKGIANGVGIPIGIVRSLKRTANEYTKKFIFGFYLDKGPDYAIYAEINNGFHYCLGFLIGAILSTVTMDIALFIVMLPTGLVSFAIKLGSAILSIVNGGNPIIGYLVPGAIINCIVLYIAFIL